MWLTTKKTRTLFWSFGFLLLSWLQLNIITAINHSLLLWVVCYPSVITFHHYFHRNKVCRYCQYRREGEVDLIERNQHFTAVFGGDVFMVSLTFKRDLSTTVRSRFESHTKIKLAFRKPCYWCVDNPLWRNTRTSLAAGLPASFGVLTRRYGSAGAGGRGVGDGARHGPRSQALCRHFVEVPEDDKSNYSQRRCLAMTPVVCKATCSWWLLRVGVKEEKSSIQPQLGRVTREESREGRSVFWLFAELLSFIQGPCGGKFYGLLCHCWRKLV